jgi:hypothetical protein
MNGTKTLPTSLKNDLIHKLWHQMQYCIILHKFLSWQEISIFLGFGLWIKFVKGKNCVNFNQFSRTFVFLLHLQM